MNQSFPIYSENIPADKIYSLLKNELPDHLGIQAELSKSEEGNRDWADFFIKVTTDPVMFTAAVSGVSAIGGAVAFVINQYLKIIHFRKQMEENEKNRQHQSDEKEKDRKLEQDKIEWEREKLLMENESNLITKTKVLVKAGDQSYRLLKNSTKEDRELFWKRVKELQVEPDYVAFD